MGGDEFCVLAARDGQERVSVVELTTKALEDEGEGFPDHVRLRRDRLARRDGSASEALHMVDARLYSNKDSRRASAVRQSKDVLLSVLNERDAELRGRLEQRVAQLARAVGRRLELPPAELHDLGLAAELHDVGKLAIPDAILTKPEPLNEDEWTFIHRHTLVGERILSAAPLSRRSNRAFDPRTGGRAGLSGRFQRDGHPASLGSSARATRSSR